MLQELSLDNPFSNDIIEMIFLDTPPITILENALLVLGFRNLYEFREFSKKQLTPLVVSQLQDIFLELIPYYPPNKCAVTMDMKKGNYITVLKHLAEAHGLRLKSRELGKFRVIHYSIEIVKPPEEFVIVFN